MQKWYKSWLKSHPAYYAGLTSYEIRNISLDTIIVSGLTGDELHPPHTAAALNELLPNSEIELWSDRFSTQETEELRSKGGAYCDSALVPILDRFIRQHT